MADFDFPLDGHGIASTTEFSRLFTLDFDLRESARCGECLGIVFEDGVSNGTPATHNVATIEFESITPGLRSCEVCVVGPHEFLRADCNFSGVVDVSDPIALLGSLFFGAYARRCDDACDADDDGRLTIGDAIFSLNHLFLPGHPAPPAPGINPPAGTDPTADGLGCESAPRSCA